MLKRLVLHPDELRGIHVRAWNAAEHSLCLKKKVGACLILIPTPVPGIKDLKPLFFTGYGGWMEDCGSCKREESGIWTQDGCWSLHAEYRALHEYSKANEVLKHVFCPMEERAIAYTNEFVKRVMFVTHGPCDQCMKQLVFHGIDHVLFQIPYKTDYTRWRPYIGVHQLEVLESSDDGVPCIKLGEIRPV